MELQDQGLIWWESRMVLSMCYLLLGGGTFEREKGNRRGIGREWRTDRECIHLLAYSLNIPAMTVNWVENPEAEGTTKSPMLVTRTSMLLPIVYICRNLESRARTMALHCGMQVFSAGSNYQTKGPSFGEHFITGILGIIKYRSFSLTFCLYVY